MDICNFLLLLPSCGVFITTNSTTLLYTPPRLNYKYIASLFRYYRGNPNEKKMDRDV